MVRFAVGALIAATIGGASLGSATSIPAWSDAIGPGGTSGPSGPTSAPGPTGPTGPTGPPAPTPCTTASLQLMESNKRNNVSETYVALPSGRVLGHRVAIAAP